MLKNSLLFIDIIVDFNAEKNRKWNKKNLVI